jgi:3-hydroxyacyl-CoA dehydrogenase
MQGQWAGVRVDRVGDVVILVIAHPPVNALSDQVRRALAEGLQAAQDDPDIIAVVLRGEGKCFSAGADIAEFGKGKPVLRLGDLCLRIENCRLPVIAALHGVALGGGMELALAAHYRIAEATATMGLPEVNLGLLPGAGGTQRLPRLVGAAEALRMMLGGGAIGAPEALALGLVDRVVETALTEAAVEMALEGLVPRRTGDRRTGFKDMVGYQAAVRAARVAEKGNRLPAPSRIIDCVEAAAVLTLQQGLDAEAVAFGDLVGTPEAAGLRHAFFVERRAALPPPAVAAKGVAPITTVGILGTDDQATDLAFQVLTAGLRVVLTGRDRDAVVMALERIALRQEQAVVAGTLTEDARDADWARIVTSLSVEALAGVDLVVTSDEVTDLPDGVDGLILAGLGVAREGGHPVAITVPSGRSGLAELSMTEASPPEAVARVLALARRLGWRVVFAGPGGPVELGLRQALAGAVAHLEAEGAARAEITAALASYGIGAGATSFLPEMPRGGARLVACCLAAMAAEGARMLQRGQARRPLEIDAVALLSGLMPRWTGGPMFQADERGMLVFRQDLLTLAERSALFLPAELIDDLIAEGQSFASLNAR